MKNSTRDENALTIDKTIIDIIATAEPHNVQQLLDILRERTRIPEKAFLEHIVRLQSEGRIVLRGPRALHSATLEEYLMTSETRWYWTLILLVMLNVLSVVGIPENAFPLVYLRYALGLVFVLWLPGYCLVRTLFPVGSSFDEGRNLHFIDRIVLSIGISIALVAMLGLLLSYTSLGIRLVPILFCLLSLSVIFATAALLREYRVKPTSDFQRSEAL